MDYIKKLPKEPSVKQQGLNLYKFDSNNKEIDIYFEDCFKGHDKYNKNIISTHLYYVLNGEGQFKIDNKVFNVKKDDLIEIPPNTEFVFTGEMKLLLIMNPPFTPENSIDGKDNDLY